MLHLYIWLHSSETKLKKKKLFARQVTIFFTFYRIRHFTVTFTNAAFEYHPVSITCRPHYYNLHQSKYHFVVILCSCRTLKFASGLPSSGIQLYTCTTFLYPHACYISLPSRPSWFILLKGIRLREKFVQYKKAESVSGRSVGVLEERVLLCWCAWGKGAIDMWEGNAKGVREWMAVGAWYECAAGVWDRNVAGVWERVWVHLRMGWWECLQRDSQGVPERAVDGAWDRCAHGV